MNYWSWPKSSPRAPSLTWRRRSTRSVARPRPLRDSDVTPFIISYWEMIKERIHLWGSPAAAPQTAARPLVPSAVSQGRFQLNRLNVWDVLIPQPLRLSLHSHLWRWTSEYMDKTIFLWHSVWRSKLSVYEISLFRHHTERVAYCWVGFRDCLEIIGQVREEEEKNHSTITWWVFYILKMTEASCENMNPKCFFFIQNICSATHFQVA